MDSKIEKEYLPEQIEVTRNDYFLNNGISSNTKWGRICRNVSFGSSMLLIISGLFSKTMITHDLPDLQETGKPVRNEGLSLYEVLTIGVLIIASVTFILPSLVDLSILVREMFR